MVDLRMGTTVEGVAMLRAMYKDRSERPPSVRRSEFLDDGTLVTTEYDLRGQVVRQTYYWSPDQTQLLRILASLRQMPGQR